LANDVVRAARPPFDPGSTGTELRNSCSDVRRGGALEPGARALTPKLAGESRGYFHTSLSCVAAQKAFLSQAGPHSDLDLFKLSITLRFRRCRSPSKRQGRPSWVAPRLARHAARGLARTPSSEGWVATRQDRRGAGRPGPEVCVGKDVRHGLGVDTRKKDRSLERVLQGIQTKT
jgi:hypothetical protein